MMRGRIPINRSISTAFSNVSPPTILRLNWMPYKFSSKSFNFTRRVIYRSASTGSSKTTFLCTNCGHEMNKWYGQCPSCKTWDCVKLYQPPKAPAKANGSSQRSTNVRTRLQQRPQSWRVSSSMGTIPDNVPTTVKEDQVDTNTSFAQKFNYNRADTTTTGLTRLDQVDLGQIGRRQKLGARELDRVLGGGLMRGSVVLIGGSPGVGKSTLMLQLAALLCSGQNTSEYVTLLNSSVNTPSDILQSVAYISGEESIQQIKSRADRLGILAPNLMLMNETCMDTVIEDLISYTEQSRESSNVLPLAAVVIDSIQTMFLEELSGAAGTVSQVRECALQLLQFAKATQIPVFLVGHVTKSGDLAGPRVLEHLVDTVLSLEGEGSHSHRILRSIKNRFGSTAEVAVLEMGEAGLAEVDNPGELFLSFDPSKSHHAHENDLYGSNAGTGSAVASTLEGTRSLCVEVQALVTTTAFEYPRHRTTGMSADRLHMLLAILNRHANVKPKRADVFLNAVGGLRLVDPAVDLAAAMSIASSVNQIPLPRDVIFIGELGLGGELRPIPHLQLRINSAAQLGFRRALVPSQQSKKIKRNTEKDGIKKTNSGNVLVEPKGLEIIPISTIGQAVYWLKSNTNVNN